jgi:hypothetical protein
MEAACTNGKPGVLLVSKLISFNVDAVNVGIVRTEHNLRDKAQVIGKPG